MTEQSHGPDLPELLALPLLIEFKVAYPLLRYGRTQAYADAKAGKFPVPIHHRGRLMLVRKVDLMAEFGLTIDGKQIPAVATGPIPVIPPSAA